MTRLLCLLGVITALGAACSDSPATPPRATTAATTRAAPAATTTVAAPVPLTAAPAQPTVPPAPPPTTAPVQQQQVPPPLAASGVTFVSVNGAPPNGTASVTVKTSPGASCSISYTTPAGTASKAQGLLPATAGSDGTVRWSWKIGSSTRPGTGSVTVTCAGVSASAPITIG